VLVYVNEFLPTRDDIVTLKREVAAGTTDVFPAPGTADRALLDGWSTKVKGTPEFSLEYRFTRALRVVSVTEASIEKAVSEFDQVVGRVEVCRGKERNSGIILASWEQNASDPSTCTACDSRTFCPAYSDEKAPTLPAVRAD
jgi:hypothetical protein